MNDKKALFRIIAVVLVAFAVYKVISVLFVYHIEDPTYNKIAAESTILICALGAAAVTKKLDVLKWSTKGLGTGILVGMVILVQSLLSLFVWIIGVMAGTQQITLPVGKIILLLIAVVMIGVAEELLFRGVLLNGFLDYFGENSVADLRKAIIISGCIFGAVHIFNVFSGASLVGCVVQAIDAGVSGMIFGTVYVRTRKNLWASILLHTFLDFCAFAQSGALMGVSTKATISGYSPMMLGKTFFVFLILLFLLRKKKLLPLTGTGSAE